MQTLVHAVLGMLAVFNSQFSDRLWLETVEEFLEDGVVSNHGRVWHHLDRAKYGSDPRTELVVLKQVQGMSKAELCHGIKSGKVVELHHLDRRAIAA